MTSRKWRGVSSESTAVDHMRDAIGSDVQNDIALSGFNDIFHISAYWSIPDYNHYPGKCLVSYLVELGLTNISQCRAACDANDWCLSFLVEGPRPDGMVNCSLNRATCAAGLLGVRDTYSYFKRSKRKCTAPPPLFLLRLKVHVPRYHCHR
jgi:hypothetical protein